MEWNDMLNAVERILKENNQTLEFKDYSVSGFGTKNKETGEVKKLNQTFREVR